MSSIVATAMMNTTRIQLVMNAASENAEPWSSAHAVEVKALVERRPPPAGTQHHLEQHRKARRLANAKHTLHAAGRRIGELDAAKAIVDRHEEVGQSGRGRVA